MGSIPSATAAGRTRGWSGRCWSRHPGSGQNQEHDYRATMKTMGLRWAWVTRLVSAWARPDTVMNLANMPEQARIRNSMVMFSTVSMMERQIFRKGVP